jgi:predicted DNA-binding antitoxin AbrB/MazE fold protein
MSITVDAVSENGVLKPIGPLPWKDGERVSVTVWSLEDSPLVRSYGIIGWTGDAETVRRIALDPESLPEEARSPWASSLPPGAEDEHEHNH